MSETIERSSLDLRYEGYRLRNNAAEARLLASIAERGVEEPLGGVDTPQGPLLLDGFRRNRCAAKLGIECVPYVSWGECETQGIVSLLSARRQRTLSILEQARFVDELLSAHSMTMADVAELLSRSKAWVSTRHNLLAQMSPAIQEILFRGAFPVYSYMVTLRPFMRMNGIGQVDIERFVQAVAGTKLSVREIELLAHGYFRGTPSLREAIDQGNWKWTLQQMQEVAADPEGLSDFERGVLRELERLLQGMQKVMTRCESPRLQARDFFAQANLLLAGFRSIRTTDRISGGIGRSRVRSTERLMYMRGVRFGSPHVTSKELLDQELSGECQDPSPQMHLCPSEILSPRLLRPSESSRLRLRLVGLPAAARGSALLAC